MWTKLNVNNCPLFKLFFALFRPCLKAVVNTVGGLLASRRVFCWLPFVFLCSYPTIRETIDRMKLVIYSARQFGIKDMELKTVRVRNIVWMVGCTRWSEAYLVTLTDRCSFLCVSGQRGTIAKSMHEEHLCVVALTSMERGTQFFPLASYLLV